MVSLRMAPVLWSALLVTLIGLTEVTGEESVSDASLLSDETEDDMEKRAGSRACQRCLHDSDDWGSCLACFSRPGPAPYYGEKKRAVDPYAWDVEKKAVDPYDWDVKRAYNPYDWRSFSAADLEKRAYNPYEFEKRAYNPYDWRSFDSTDFEKRAYNPYDMEVKKRGLSSCRCCMKIRLTSCCNKCSYAPYFTKRAYRTSYRPQFGENCACCRKDRFNYGCCLNCAGKRK
uniref:AYNPY neuropeptide n=1 Tax=Platynereis dumerilii TaxID=6359 RepID=V5TBY8_PLADU|nr:AYNPY neuropeptide precursor [Platynereis dumerilii]